MVGNMLVDSHCHVCDIKDFEPEKGVLPVACSYSNGSNVKTIAAAKRFSLPFTLGIAPQTALREGIAKLDEWIDLIKKSRPNAIGEIGLDFHWAKTKEDIEKQRQLFDKMLALADSMKLPVVIHSRDATSEVIQTLNDFGFSRGIVFHFFSGNAKEADAAIDMGALLSFTPLHSKERRSIINRIGLEHILVETDAPYVCRTPGEVIKAIEYVAEVKSIDCDAVAKQTAKNAIGFFKIKI